MTSGPPQTELTRGLRLAAGRGLAACQQVFSRTVSAALGAGLALAGYPAAPTRQRVARQDLEKRRRASDAEITKTLRVRLGQALDRTKVKYDQYVAGETKAPPVFNVLIISGGGDWGAFGAGFLKGWHRIPAVHPLAMPEFDVVTGVSTGTLIAPFAFLGDTRSIDLIANLYRNPGADWVKPRGRLYFLPDNISFAEVPGLEREVRSHLDLDMIRRIAGLAPMVASCSSTPPILTTLRHVPSTWLPKHGMRLSWANSIVFTISHSRRPESPPHFRSA